MDAGGDHLHALPLPHSRAPIPPQRAFTRILCCGFTSGAGLYIRSTGFTSEAWILCLELPVLHPEQKFYFRSLVLQLKLRF